MRITDRDRELLGFVAEHRLVLASHARALMDTSAGAAYQRLGSLARAGWLSHRTVFHQQPGCYQITRAGLAVIEADLPPPRIDLRSYRHDVGVAWLWLAARAGAFGDLQDVISERTMRSVDASAAARGEPLAEPHGVRIGGVGPRGRVRLHYPDLLLRAGAGQRIALELELSGKGRMRREGILSGYGADRRIDAVLYLTDSTTVARAIRSAAARVGVATLVHTQRLRLPPSIASPDARRAPVRGARREDLAR